MENKKKYNMEEVALTLGSLPENERELLLSAFKLDALASAANNYVVREHIVHWVDSYINIMSDLKDSFIRYTEKIHSENFVCSYDKEMEMFIKFREDLSREDKDKIDALFDENPICVPNGNLNSKLNYEASFKNMAISVYDELEKNRKEDELFLGISNKLFDRMVTNVSDVSNNEYDIIKTRLYNMFERLSKISNFEADAIMLEVNGIEIKRNVFDMLEAISKNWCNYTDLEKRSIGKLVDYIAFVDSVQTFYDLMENWDKVLILSKK